MENHKPMDSKSPMSVARRSRDCTFPSLNTLLTQGDTVILSYYHITITCSTLSVLETM